MKVRFRIRPAKLLSGVAIAGLAAALAAGELPDRRESDGRDREEVARMTNNSKTLCVGRFLIDLPADAQVTWLGTRIDRLDIDAFDESAEDFRERLSARQKDIEATPDRHGGPNNLESVRELATADGMQGKMFVQGREVTDGWALNGLDREYFRYENVAIEAMIHGQGVSVDLVASSCNPANIDDLPRLVSRIVPNPGRGAPTTPGFCLQNIHVRALLTADQNESASVAAYLPSHPDVGFQLMVMAGLKPNDRTLLERSAESSLLFSLLQRARIHRIRGDQRTVSGLVADELARRFIGNEGIARYSFWWEFNGKEDDVMAPRFSLTMLTGTGANGPVPSSLSETAASALWDRVVSSIRHRPVGMPPRPMEKPDVAAPGAQALTGESCVQPRCARAAVRAAPIQPHTSWKPMRHVATQASIDAPA